MMISKQAKILGVLFAFTVFLTLPPTAEAKPYSVDPGLQGMQLYKAGKIEEARKSFLSDLEESRTSAKPGVRWQALMSIAWFENEVGNYRQSIEYSNEALETAGKIPNAFMVGRSLAWLGWGYSSLGLYELALEFYEQAVEIGAPEGKPTIPAVWGLASQEMGATYFKMGDTAAAIQTIKKTMDFGRARGIAVAIAEGGAHLAEIYLYQGKYDEAEMLANEALEASLRCSCSPYNTSRARVVLAKVATDKALRDATYLENAKAVVEETLLAAKKSGHARQQAESLLLLSKLQPKRDFSKRQKLIAQAFEMLANQESELRGTAEVQLGQLYAEEEKTKLAAYYLENGLKVNEELFRKVDDSYAYRVASDIKLLKGEKAKAAKTLIAGFDKAVAGKAYPEALHIAEKLAKLFEEQQHLKLVHDWADKGINVVLKIIEQNPTLPREELYKLEDRQAALEVQKFNALVN